MAYESVSQEKLQSMADRLDKVIRQAGDVRRMMVVNTESETPLQVSKAIEAIERLEKWGRRLMADYENGKITAEKKAITDHEAKKARAPKPQK